MGRRRSVALANLAKETPSGRPDDASTSVEPSTHGFQGNIRDVPGCRAHRAAGQKPGACVNVPEKEKIHEVPPPGTGVSVAHDRPNAPKDARTAAQIALDSDSSGNSVDHAFPRSTKPTLPSNTNADYLRGRNRRWRIDTSPGSSRRLSCDREKRRRERSGVSYVPSSVRNERSDHSSVTCAGGSRACCCGETCWFAPAGE